MKYKDGVRETAEALRTRFGKEILTPAEVMQVTGYSKSSVTRLYGGWIGNGSGKRIAVEVLARQMVG